MAERPIAKGQLPIGASQEANCPYVPGQLSLFLFLLFPFTFDLYYLSYLSLFFSSLCLLPAIRG